MAKGGHASSGPAPDPNALRRDRKADQSEWIDLPAAGRDGPPLVWPLENATPRELELWAREWRRPQAVEWERRGQDVEVALLVRSIVTSEAPKATAADRNVTQRLMTDLGLTVPGLRAARWRIVDASVTAPVKRAARTKSARDRLKVVQGGAAEDDGGSP